MSLAARLHDLQEKYQGRDAEELLDAFLNKEFPGKIALVSSFGIEAGLLLDMVAKVNPNTPVIFLDTHKLFSETLAYRDTLISHMGLKNVKTYHPDYIDLSRDDPEGNLWEKKPGSCCFIRKVKPLNRALEGYDAWITGRKRYHGGMRIDLPFIEFFDGRIKVNPLAAWNAGQIRDEYDRRNIPLHPLAENGYTSVGCVPCTSLPVDGQDVRSGRWKGEDRTECGIHIDSEGRVQKGKSL